MVPIEKASHKDRTCRQNINALSSILQKIIISQVKVFVTDE